MGLSPDAWATIGVGITATASSVTAIVIAHIKTKHRIKITNDKVNQVKELAEPTGNGFAQRTTDKLDNIANGVEGLQIWALQVDKTLMDHLTDHARGTFRGERISD